MHLPQFTWISGWASSCLVMLGPTLFGCTEPEPSSTSSAAPPATMAARTGTEGQRANQSSASDQSDGATSERPVLRALPARSDLVAPLRTPEELRTELKRACVEATEQKRSILLDFGADWCADCRTLHIMKHREPLATELSHWQVVDINITDPDRHADLTKAFQVKAIARWVVLRPGDCAQPVTAWTVGPSRVVEPTNRGAATAADLTAWLQQSRQ